MISEQSNPLPTVRYVIFGSTGVGKSTLGNVLLCKNYFETSDSFESCTKEPFSHFNTVNGVKIIVTDTVGLNDALFDNEEVLKNLASYFQNDFHGPINYFLLLQKFTERFTKDMFQNINMLLTSFVGSVPTQNIKIVLTHVKGKPEKINEKVTKFRKQMLMLFDKETSEIKDQIKNIPILLVNNHPNPAKRTPLPSDISPFQPNPAPAINPCQFSPKGYSLTEEINVQEGFIDKSTDDGIQIFATLIHRKRTKFTSFDKKTTTYSDWENIDGQKPLTICIQNVEYDKQVEEKNEINETEGDKKIKRIIHYLYKKKRFQRKKYNKKENQGEKKENSEVFYELTDALNIDGRTITFTESKIENDITTFYSAWYTDPDSEIKYEIQEITRPFENILESCDTKTKIFGEEMQVLKIEYKKDQSDQWQKDKTNTEQNWHATKTNLNATKRETRTQESNQEENLSNPKRHKLIHKTWQEERTVTFYDNVRTTETKWKQIPGTENTTTTITETRYRNQKIEGHNQKIKYYTHMETTYEALERVERETNYTTFREKKEITKIDGTITNETEWYKVPYSEEQYTKIEMYEIRGTKEPKYLKIYNGIHYHYFGVDHYSPFYGLEDRFILRIYKKGSSSPIDENIGNWTSLSFTKDTERWECIESGISGKVRKL